MAQLRVVGTLHERGGVTPRFREALPALLTARKPQTQQFRAQLTSTSGLAIVR